MVVVVVVDLRLVLMLLLILGRCLESQLVSSLLGVRLWYPLGSTRVRIGMTFAYVVILGVTVVKKNEIDSSSSVHLCESFFICDLMYSGF